MSFRPTGSIAAAAVFLTLAASQASATAVRTLVSGKGSDTGSCPLVAPCRTFTFALTATSAGGEIVVLDSAGYGAVTITKPITISNQTGVEGGIIVNSGDAVVVNVTALSGIVMLKGLTIDGSGSAGDGIDVQSIGAGGHLDIVDCTVRNFSSSGLHMTESLTAYALVSDSIFAGNGDGIVVSPQGGAIAWMDIRHTIVSQNTDDGIKLMGNAGDPTGTITAVDASQNGENGIELTGTVHFSVAIQSSVMQSNGNFDLVLSSGPTAQLFDHNLIDFLSNGGSVQSDGSNHILGSSGSSPTPLPPK